MKFNALVVLCCLVALPAAASAIGLQEYGTSPSVSLDLVTYDVEIDGHYADAQLELALRQDDGEEGTAQVRFPLPSGAVLYRAEVLVDGEWLMAATQGRRESQQTYEEEEDDRPLLVQRIGLDFYRAKVRIDGDSTQLVRLRYAHPLERTDDGLAARIAIANPDATPAAPTRGLKATFRYAPEWDRVSWRAYPDEASPSARLEDASLGLGETDLDTDLVLQLDRAERTDVAGVTYTPEEGPRQLHARWYPTIDDASTATAARNVVFVIDGSGSMMGAKLDETTKVLGRALQTLRPEDRWGMLVFDEDETHAARTEMAAGDDLAGVDVWLGDLRTGGGTGLYYGLDRAVEIGATSDVDGPVDIVVATDGLPNVGPTKISELVSHVLMEGRARDRTFRIFALGIGHDLDQAYLNELTQKTGGEATFALDDAEITTQFLDLMARVRPGGVQHAEAEVTAGEAGELYTRRRMFAGDPIDFALEFEGSEPFEFAFSATTPSIESETDDALLDEPVDRLFAAPLAGKAFADRLERRIDERGESDDLVADAVVLARRYGIVSRYSGFVAGEDVELLERDEAGMAIGQLDASDVALDESRIGGAGVPQSAGGDEAVSCSTTSSRSAPGWLLLVVLAIGNRRRSRRRR